MIDTEFTGSSLPTGLIQTGSDPGKHDLSNQMVRAEWGSNKVRNSRMLLSLIHI